MGTRLFPLLICTIALVAGAAHAAPQPGDVEALLAGVSDIAAPGWPGCLSVYGPEAFVVVTGSSSREIQAPVVAAARMGEGRIVALGHNGYFGAEALRTGDTGRLILNAVSWLAVGAEPRVLVQSLDDTLALLLDEGLDARPIAADGWVERLGEANVLVTTRPPAYTDEQAAAVADFVRAGGGLLSGDTPWGWLQLNPGKSLTADHGGNRVISPAGLVWADGGLGKTSDIGFAADRGPSRYVHAGEALDALEARVAGEVALSKEDAAQAAWTVTHAARSVLPDDTLLRPRLHALQLRYAAEAVPSPDSPLTLEQPLARLALALQMQQIARQSPEQVAAHPSATHFPGPVPAEAPRVTQTISVDTHVPDWHSTGLYAAPGEVVTVTLPQEAAGQGLRVRIGCHSDGIWHHDQWKRAPEIARSLPLDAHRTAAANAFGGLVYIEVPRDCRLGTIPVEIAGAVEAPLFVLGQTDPATWRERVRGRPGPWAEIQTSKVILTVPSADIRELEDPVPLAEFWTSIADSCNELIGRPLQRDRPERYVADVQISAGYMHSGYPIMTHLDGAKMAVDLERLQSKGSWGHFHEIGHNHQQGDWTFGGTGEVTVNLFSLYIIDRCCGLKDVGHPAVKPEDRARKTAEHIAGGADFGKWKSDPFLALYMYMQLQEAFGWEAYKAVFAEYRDLPADERPKTDDEKRDQWLVRFSRTVGRNLGPFFEAWGVPTSETARASIAELPEWMPPDFPPS
jgi:hypothetical protein